jgi:hypothetical protein
MSIIQPKKFLSMGTFNSGNTTFGGGSGEIITWSTSDYDSRSEVENQTVTEYVFFLTATSSLGGTITYTKVSGLDAALFGNVLTSGNGSKYVQISSMPNFEAPTDSNADNVYQITIRATSSNGATADKTFSLTITNEVITWNTATNLNAYEGFPEITLDATSNNGLGCNYLITGGADQADFSITANILRFYPSVDYNAPADADTNNVYVVTIDAYTNGEAVSRTFNITVLETFTITMTNLDRFSGPDQKIYLTATANGSDVTTSAISLNASGTLISASALATAMQSALNTAISASTDVTVTLESDTVSSRSYLVKYLPANLVSDLVVSTAPPYVSQLYPTITLTEAKVTDGVTGVKDTFTVTAYSQAPHAVALSPAGSFGFGDDATTITSSTPPSGFTTTTATAGVVTFTQDTGAPLGYTFSVASGNGTIAAQGDGVTYVAPVTGVNEVVTLTVGASDGTTTTSSGGSVDSTAGSITAVNANPSGYSVSGGGAGNGFVTWTANSTGVQTDETISSNGSGGSILVDVQGVTAVTEVTEVKAYVTINVTSVPTFDFTFNTGGAAGGSGTVGSGGNFSAFTPPSNYSVISGGVGSTTAVVEQTTATTLGSRYAMATGNGYASIGTYTDGVTEVLEVHTITPTPVNPTGGSWQPSGARTVVAYNESAAGIAYIIGTDMGAGGVTCTGTLDAGAVTITQLVGEPVSDTALAPANYSLTAPEITVAIT